MKTHLSFYRIICGLGGRQDTEDVGTDQSEQNR